MEEIQSKFMEKLEVFGILKESLKIPYKNHKFILLTFLTSLPLIFIMILHEIILQTTMIQTKIFLTSPRPNLYKDIFYEDDPYNYYFNYNSFLFFSEPSVKTSIRLFQNMSLVLIQMCFLYFVPLHVLDLINTIITVNSVSVIYAEEKPINIKQMLYKLKEIKKFKGSRITSICVLSLNSVVLVGFIWAITNYIIPSMGMFFVVVYGIFSVLLLAKWMEWSALWNMAIVFSVLEEKHGLEALRISAYFSTDNKRRGLYLMEIFFVWRVALRLACVYVGGHEKWMALAATSVLSCASNVMKWVVCTIYFYDCKKRVLEKKIEVEEGRKVDTADMVSVC